MSRGRETRPGEAPAETRPAPRQIEFSTNAGRLGFIRWTRDRANESGRPDVAEEVVRRFRAGEPVSLGAVPETMLPELEAIAALKDVGIVVLGGDVINEPEEGDDDAE